ncbi:hypothetical protein BJV77DRAFT_1071851 [Russula vinacea]|nr:hypothetical protein BJV77DRAFT_1071851 [Russula vinacea]
MSSPDDDDSPSESLTCHPPPTQDLPPPQPGSGIDLGTTNPCTSVIEDKTSCIIKNLEGARTTPSNAVFAFKCLTGRQLGDKEPFNAVPKPNGRPTYVLLVCWRTLVDGPHQTKGKLIRSHAVIAMPAYFNDAQHQATKNAGQFTGLKVLQVINKPTAAVLAYGLDRAENSVIFGQVNKWRYPSWWRGLCIVLVEHIINSFKKETGIDLAKDQMAVQRICEAAEKISLESLECLGHLGTILEVWVALVEEIVSSPKITPRLVRD